MSRGFVRVVLSDFSMAIILSSNTRVLIDGWFASPRIAFTRVVGSWPVMARFSNVEFEIHGSHEDAPYSTLERPSAMLVARGV